MWLFVQLPEKGVCVTCRTELAPRTVVAVLLHHVEGFSISGVVRCQRCAGSITSRADELAIETAPETS